MEGVKTVSREVVYEGRVIRLVKDSVLLPSGRKAVREIVLHPSSVSILPLIDDDHIVMVEQFRYAVGSKLLEIPAGTLEAGETPEKCALRELA